MSDCAQNLLFIMTDHQRADSLGMVQAGVEVTPNLNHMAAEGADFRRAYTTCPLCVPARTALATGIYPTRNGVITNDWRGRTTSDCMTLHQLFAEKGYDVAHIGVDHIRAEPGLRDCIDFDVWNGNREYTTHLASAGIVEAADQLMGFKREVLEKQGQAYEAAHYSNTRVETWPHAVEYFKDLYWCRVAVDFLSRERSRPFALFLCLWAPHPPLRLPEPYASAFAPAGLTLPRNVGIVPELEPANRRRGIAAQLAEGLTDEEWRLVWAAHLGLVHLADAGIGQVLCALERQGFSENTLTVFTADHGDHLGQHSMYQKMEMYEPAIHIPLVMRGPGIKASRISTPVSHLDVFPTIASRLDLARPGDADGRSLGPALGGGELPLLPVYSQYSGNPVVGDLRRCVIDGDLKYVYDPCADPELHDLSSDPLEMHNLAGDLSHAGTLARMHALCRAWGRSHDDPVFPDES